VSGQDVCVCGHLRIHHIHEEGACRPGFECAANCTEFRPLPAPKVTEVQVTLCTQENRGDHAADVRIAAKAEPGETVHQMVERLMRLGAHQRPYMASEPPSAWIELRYVDGTQPEPTRVQEPPF
jgi:hypothetical protein